MPLTATPPSSGNDIGLLPASTICAHEQAEEEEEDAWELSAEQLAELEKLSKMVDDDLNDASSSKGVEADEEEKELEEEGEAELCSYAKDMCGEMLG